MQQSRSFQAAVFEHELHVTEWGDRSNPALIMWHGLARNGRDFDALARYCSQYYWVLCPDTIGRGFSTWSSSPENQYTIPYYCQLANGLMDLLNIETVDWVGTSMGGLMGMGLAAQFEGMPKPRIRRLVLNDVGPQLNETAMERIKKYVQVPFECANLRQYEVFLRMAYAPFGIKDDDTWAALARNSVRRLPNGNFTHHYDMKVMDVVANTPGPVDMWAFYDTITAPTLVIRGAESDLFPAEIAQQMTTRGPQASLATIAGCGHAPFLDTPEQMRLILDFLRQ